MSKIHTPSSSQPSFFFGYYELPSLTIGVLKDPLGEQPEIFEEPIREEVEPISSFQTMAKNQNNELFPIRETNGECRMKNVSHVALPHFHGLTSKDLDIFMFDFVVVCRTYDYASHDHN